MERIEVYTCWNKKVYAIQVSHQGPEIDSEGIRSILRGKGSFQRDRYFPNIPNPTYEVNTIRDGVRLILERETWDYRDCSCLFRNTFMGLTSEHSKKSFVDGLVDLSSKVKDRHENLYSLFFKGDGPYLEMFRQIDPLKAAEFFFRFREYKIAIEFARNAGFDRDMIEQTINIAYLGIKKRTMGGSLSLTNYIAIFGKNPSAFVIDDYISNGDFDGAMGLAKCFERPEDRKRFIRIAKKAEVSQELKKLELARKNLERILKRLS